MFLHTNVRQARGKISYSATTRVPASLRIITSWIIDGIFVISVVTVFRCHYATVIANTVLDAHPSGMQPSTSFLYAKELGHINLGQSLAGVDEVRSPKSLYRLRSNEHPIVGGLLPSKCDRLPLYASVKHIARYINSTTSN